MDLPVFIYFLFDIIKGSPSLPRYFTQPLSGFSPDSPQQLRDMIDIILLPCVMCSGNVAGIPTITRLGWIWAGSPHKTDIISRVNATSALGIFRPQSRRLKRVEDLR